MFIYNSSMQMVGSAKAPASFGGTATATVNGVVAGQTYYIRTFGADTGPSGIGAFGLLVNAGSSSMTPIQTPNTVVYAQPSQGGGFEFQLVGPISPYLPGGGKSGQGLIEIGNSGFWANGDQLSTASTASGPTGQSANWCGAVRNFHNRRRLVARLVWTIGRCGQRFAGRGLNRSCDSFERPGSRLVGLAHHP